VQLAEGICRKLLEQRPEDPQRMYFIGLLAQHVGDLDLAVEAVAEAVRREPGQAAWHNHLGEILKALGRLPEAVACYERALAADPGFALAHNNLGVALRAQGRLDEAIACYERARAADPRLAIAWNNLAVALVLKGDRAQAARHYRQAISIDPAYAEPHYNLGNMARESGAWDLAAMLYRRAVELRPDHGDALAQLYYLSQWRCDWRALAELAPKLDALTEEVLAKGGARTGETPFISLAKCSDPSRNYRVAQAWGREITRRASTAPGGLFSFADRKKRRIRIGYLSPDFRNHPVARAISEITVQHDRGRFEVIAYSYGIDDGSRCRSRIGASCDAFVDIASLSYRDAAQRIYADDIDVLVDLAGHTHGTRLEIAALRPAPIQVSYLGFPGTIGAEFIDYIITDRTVTPPAQQSYYSEKFVYLPHCFMAVGRREPSTGTELRRSDFGLPDDGPVFCSFSATYKLEPIMFGLWMDVLRQTPGSVLWLACDDGTTRTNLQHQAEARGVEGERLRFASRLPYESHLERLTLADLGLDTRIYNGGATTTDALSAGVPVIALRGRHFASRMSASILTAAGLPELVVDSLDEYGALAVRLAREPRALEAIRRRLRANRLSQPLFDTTGFVRHLERAYSQMWELFTAGEKPRQIEVAEN
jgi:protein O-GlcNAc transferase